MTVKIHNSKWNKVILNTFIHETKFHFSLITKTFIREQFLSPGFVFLHLPFTMVGITKSDMLKAREKSEIMDTLYALALALYQTDHTPGIRLDRKPLSLQKCCDNVTEQYQAEHQKQPPKKLATSTLDHLVKGGIPKSTSNASRGWFTTAEAKMVVHYSLEMACRGFPLTHELLKVEVDGICSAHLGNLFPEEGVGHQWTNRFVEKYHKELKMHWASFLDDKCGRAVNPATNTQ